MDITYSEYWTEIESLCAETYSEAKEHQREPYEQLWETLDGHQWVIYTGYAFDVLKHSDHDGYAIEEWGADGIVENGAISWAKLVFGAMLGDCLDRADFDWNEIPEEAEEAEDAEL